MATSSNIDFPAILSYETVRAYSHLYIRSNVCKFTIILKIGYCLRLRDIAILYVDSMQKNSVVQSIALSSSSFFVRSRRRVVVCRVVARAFSLD